MADCENCGEESIDKKAVYEFTTSFLLSGKKAFDKLDGSSVVVDAAEGIVGGAANFVAPGLSKAAAAGTKKPIEYISKKLGIQDDEKDKEIFLEILNSDSKDEEENFYKLFIERGVAVFVAYEIPFTKITCNFGTGLNPTANKREALQKLGKRAGSVCFETIIESKSKEVETLLTALENPGKKALVKNIAENLKTPKFYYFVEESNSNSDGAAVQPRKPKKQHVTATDFFRNKYPELGELQGEDASQNKDYWCLHKLQEPQINSMLYAAISEDRRFAHLVTLFAQIKNPQVSKEQKKEIQTTINNIYSIVYMNNEEAVDSTVKETLDAEQDLTWDIKCNSKDIKKLTESVHGHEHKDEAVSLQKIISKVEELKEREKIRESLKTKWKEIDQRIDKLKGENPKWDTFVTQKLSKSNHDDLHQLADVIKFYTVSLGTAFSDEYKASETKYQEVHRNLESCALATVTNTSSLEIMRSKAKNLVDDVTKTRCEFPEIKTMLLALQDLKFCTDITTVSFENLLERDEKTARKNLADIDKLFKLTDESQSLQKTIFDGIKELEVNLDTTVLTSTAFGSSPGSAKLEEKWKDLSKGEQKLVKVYADISAVAASFDIAPNDFRERLGILRQSIDIKRKEHLKKQEGDLTRDLDEISQEINRVSGSVEKYRSESESPVKSTIIQISALRDQENKRESLKQQLKIMYQHIIELRTNNPEWDTFQTQTSYTSNCEYLEELNNKIVHTLSSLNDSLRSSFSEKFKTKEADLELLRQSLKSCAVSKVTDINGLKTMGENVKVMIVEISKMQSAVIEMRKELIALQEMKFCLGFDIASVSFETSLEKADETAFKNQIDIHKLSISVDEFESLQKEISAAIKKLETKTSEEAMNFNRLEALRGLELLQKNFEDQRQKIRKLNEVHNSILKLAPLFELLWNDAEHQRRLKNLREKIATEIEKWQQIRWGNRIEGFPPSSQFATVAVGQKIYSFGRANPNYSCGGPMDVFELNVNEQEKEWQKLSVENSEVNPNQRCGHSAVAHKKFVFIFGGVDTVQSKLSNSTYRFSTETLRWDKLKVTGIVPLARDKHSAVVVRNKMYIYGGWENNDKLTSDLHSLNLESFRWSAIETKGIPPPLSWGPSVTVHSDIFLLIFGGYHPKESKLVSTIHMFDLKSKTWSAVETRGTLPSSRMSHCAFVHNGRMYIFGGRAENESLFNNLFSFDPETSEWKEVTPNGKAPSPRFYAGCAALNDKVYICGGEHLQPNQNYLVDTCVLEM